MSLTAKSFQQIFTFPRATPAAYWDKQGRLRTAPAAVPRLDHDPVTGNFRGILVSEPATNLFPYSWNMDSWQRYAGSSSGAGFLYTASTSPKFPEWQTYTIYERAGALGDGATAFYLSNVSGVPVDSTPRYAVAIVKPLEGARQMRIGSPADSTAARRWHVQINSDINELVLTKVSNWESKPLGDGYHLIKVQADSSVGNLSSWAGIQTLNAGSLFGEDTPAWEVPYFGIFLGDYRFMEDDVIVPTNGASLTKGADVLKMDVNEEVVESNGGTILYEGTRLSFVPPPEFHETV